MILVQFLFLFQCLISSRPSCWPELYVSSNLPVFIWNTPWLWLSGYLSMSLAAGKLNVSLQNDHTSTSCPEVHWKLSLAYNEFLSINIYINTILQTTLQLIFMDVDTPLPPLCGAHSSQLHQQRSRKDMPKHAFTFLNHPHRHMQTQCVLLVTAGVFRDGSKGSRCQDKILSCMWSILKTDSDD